MNALESMKLIYTERKKNSIMNEVIERAAPLKR
jgi:hypothetical protein